MYFCPRKLSDGVTGNTSDFGSEESRFDSWSDNGKWKSDEGTRVPSFIVKIMIAESDVRNFVESRLSGSPLFLVEVTVRTGNRVAVFIDGDRPVSIVECMELSRAIEAAFPRETEDYDLEVSSSGITQPLKLHRQYVKNIGRGLKVKTHAGLVLKGKLEAVGEKSITLLLEADKKKKLPERSEIIAFEDIAEAKTEISFK